MFGRARGLAGRVGRGIPHAGGARTPGPASLPTEGMTAPILAKHPNTPLRAKGGTRGSRPRRSALRDQLTLTSIVRGLASSLFGRVTMSNPSLNVATTFPASASSGTVKERTKLPWLRSIRR